MYQSMSVFKIKDHGTSETLWVVQVYNRGKRVRLYSDPKTKKRFKSRAQALEKEAELRGRFEMESKPQQPKILCKDLADLFFASLQKKLKPSSIYTRSSFYKNYVEPNFGGYYVQDLTNDDLDRFNEKLNKAPRGSMCNVVSTVRTYVKFLRKWNPSLLPERIFEYLSSTPDDHIYHFYTLEQERKFLSVITDPRDKLLFTIFCYYGMRMTECIALKRGDISLEEGTISVRRIVLTKSLYKKQVFTTPKTKRSVRTLTLIKDVADLLKPDQDPEAYLFPGKYGAIVINEGHVRRLAKEYAKKAGLPSIKIHEFRHSCASNLIRANFPVRIVAQWLGDTESTILEYYSHMFPDEANSIGRFFDGHSLLDCRGRESLPPKPFAQQTSSLGSLSSLKS
jgi:integrase